MRLSRLALRLLVPGRPVGGTPRRKNWRKTRLLGSLAPPTIAAYQVPEGRDRVNRSRTIDHGLTRDDADHGDEEAAEGPGEARHAELVAQFLWLGHYPLNWSKRREG